MQYKLLYIPYLYISYFTHTPQSFQVIREEDNIVNRIILRFRNTMQQSLALSNSVQRSISQKGAFFAPRSRFLLRQFRQAVSLLQTMWPTTNMPYSNGVEKEATSNSGELSAEPGIPKIYILDLSIFCEQSNVYLECKSTYNKL